MDEHEIGERFLSDGYVIADAHDRHALLSLQSHVALIAASFLGGRSISPTIVFLDTIAERVTVERLNDLRLAMLDGIEPWWREAYLQCGRPLVEAVVGNELAMQRGLGLSVQLPNDDSSLLPLHSDVWSEDSPFEVVLWIPLVDCRRTKSMFLLPPAADRRWRDRVAEFASVEALYQAVEPDLIWLDVPFGSVLLFTPTLMHGNRVNREPGTRWSMNVRFKGLFTPYADKRLGEFFDPVSIRPATRIGMAYRLPRFP